MLAWLWRAFARLKLKGKYVKIGATTLFNPKTEFEGRNIINRGCILYGTHVGIGTYMGDGCVFNNTYIGKYCALGAGIRVASGDHPIHKFVTIHPAFFSVKKQGGFTFCKDDIWISERKKDVFDCHIGNDVWIGDNAIILGGISVADGSVIGAGTIVTKNTEPYGIYVGVPAKKIGSRFTEDEIQFLLRIKWWDSEFDTLSANACLFSDINKFIRNFGK